MLVLGFTLGSMAERRGLLPAFFGPDEMSLLADQVVKLPDATAALARDGSGIVFGTGEIVVTVFTDFECPYCRDLDSSIEELEKSDDFSFQYRHLPLSIHPTSKRKHRLVECSRLVGLNPNPIFRSAFNIPNTTNWSVEEHLGGLY